MTVLLCLGRSTWRLARPHRCDSPAPPRAALARLRTSIVRPSQRSPTPGSRTLATRRSCGPSRLFTAPCGPPPGSLTTTVAWCDPRRCEARSLSFRARGGDFVYRMSSSGAWHSVAICPARPPSSNGHRSPRAAFNVPPGIQRIARTGCILAKPERERDREVKRRSRGGLREV